MPNIKPVTDLVDMEEYEKQRAVIELMSELAKGDEDAVRGELFTPEQVDRELGLL